MVSPVQLAMVPMMAVSFGVISWGVVDIVQQRRELAAAEPVDAVVKDISVEKDSSGGDEGGPTYDVDITFEYTADGQVRTSDRRTPGFEYSLNSSGRDKVLADYDVGDELTAYVPNNPDSAFLEREANLGAPMFFSFVGLCLFSGQLYAFLVW